MANMKNFGLVGVGSDLQFGKTGTRLINNAGTFNFKAANGSTDAALTAAGITSSGNVTLTTGNLALSATGGIISIGATNVLQRSANGVAQISGTAGVVLPAGTTAQRGTGENGLVRVNTDVSNAHTMEFWDGDAWVTLATGGSTAGLQTEIDNIETSLGGGINSDGTFNADGFTDNAALTDPTSFTNAIQQIANYAASKDTLDEILPGTAGEIIWNNAGTWTTDLPGSTSGVQAWDADLDAVAGLSTTGFIVRTGAGTAATRDITGTSGRITVTNGDGVASSPTIDLATVTDSGTGTFLKVSTDSYGRVTGTEAVVAGDITGLVDGTYVNVAGDTMTGNLSFGGTFKVTNLAEPTAASDAATKNYVDNATTGLTWKTAVKAATTGPGTLASDFENGDTIDGVTLATGDRILIKNQTAGEENGIYIVQATGAPVRSTDADTPSELDGAAVFVQQGTTNADSGWVQTATIITVGTTPQTWNQFSGAGAYSAGDGLLLTGNVFSVNMGAGITTLPSDEVGIDVVSNLALQLTSNLTGGQLTFVLAGGSGLSQSSSGLTIAAGGVTNAMLQNSAITLDADTGTGTVSLGGTLNVIGTAGQGVSTSTTGSDIQVTVADATTTTKGVASFSSTSFTVTSGAVSLNTVGVAQGGTGATTLLDTAILIGNGTSPIEASTALTFDSATDTMTIGGATGMSIVASGGDVTISSLDTNADINLVPNGTGAVVIGATGAGVIEAEAGQSMTLTGNATLVLQSTSGDIVMTLPDNTTDKVTVAGPDATEYATNLADADLVNKYYVDQAITTGASSGSIKAVKATVNIGGTGATNIGAALPAGATVISVKVQVTSVDTGTGTLSVGVTGDVARYMTTAENDTQSLGIYLAETYYVNGGSEQVIATVAGGAVSGSAVVFVEYQVA